ncbi:NAD-dependent epimerase/dehydratase family protein [Algoriphagus sp. AGSA1]|uniref:NAD-dependent epimerase/dehydratase family protein n=1 Tax=Algoriphagus sp. AGSA1 TaxID=2907213 RepID=UPI001F16D673|nr:NAD-dependent epimerase/dehydratase family protein [Algoriphagus sp. AGSA1]MCE7053712.1 NAD-dependent epimerase/dehydratase family protein [Algoriphagus sp. AGSA1]
MQILVTGAAGFIGFHLCNRLIKEGHNVVGVDNLNSYYDPNLKLARLAELGIIGINQNDSSFPTLVAGDFTFIKADIEDDSLWSFLADDFGITSIIHLAAQAGVRYSLENPKAYIKSNIEGFLNVLEFCRNKAIDNLIYASSSSVYGMESKQPFSEEENCNKPVSLYAATKRSNELMAYTYHHLFNINSIGLRFFTVYGPWGRPDMAPFIFTKAAFEGSEIRVFNQGNQKRDFTYIDDIIAGIIQIFGQSEKIDGAEVCNIGQGRPLGLGDFIHQIEDSTGKILSKKYIEAQPGDVQVTYADTHNLREKFSYLPKIHLKEGIENFVKWYVEYYKVKDS